MQTIVQEYIPLFHTVELYNTPNNTQKQSSRKIKQTSTKYAFSKVLILTNTPLSDSIIITNICC